MQAMPKIQIGEALAHESLAVFPLFAEANGHVDYLLSDAAIAAGSVTVSEVNQAGSVPQLLVLDQADRPVLFLEGEELRGAKQNRVLNTSVLVAAGSTTPIPVSCVEQRRWRYDSPHFASGGSHASSRLRHILKKSVSASLRMQSGHRSDQGKVWREVDRQMAALECHSPTAAMADTYEAQRTRLSEFQERLKYPEGATGLAVAVGGRLASVDLLDKLATCRKVWERLLTGAVMQALEAQAPKDPVAKARVEEVLTVFRDTHWEPAPAVGIGQEFRLAAADDRQATALVLKDVLVHGSVVMAG